MRPLLLELGGLKFHAYPSMLALAFLVCTLSAARDGERLAKPVFIPPQGAVWGLLGALFGAKVFWIIQYQEFKNLWRAFLLWEPGLVFYGGLIGGVVGVTTYLYFTDNIDLRIADVLAPYVALGEGITRVGCFLNGCCWGSVCEVPWGVVFPKGSHAHGDHLRDGLISSSAVGSLPVHPTQLYMTAGLVLSFFIMRYCLKRSPFTFAIALQYMFLYGIVRFIVEIYRGDSAYSVYGMTVSQTLSLALFIGSTTAFLIVIAIRRRRSNIPPDEPPEPAEA